MIDDTALLSGYLIIDTYRNFHLACNQDCDKIPPSYFSQVRPTLSSGRVKNVPGDVFVSIPADVIAGSSKITVGTRSLRIDVPFSMVSYTFDQYSGASAKRHLIYFINFPCEHRRQTFHDDVRRTIHHYRSITHPRFVRS